MGAVIELLSALLTPLIASLAAYIAYQQWRTNERKLKLDLYERRLKVYQAVRQFIAKIVSECAPEWKDCLDLRGKTAEADFLFDEDIRQYIDSLIAHAARLRKWNNLYRSQQGSAGDKHDHQEVIEGMDQEVCWLADQPDAAREIFRRYMTLA